MMNLTLRPIDKSNWQEIALLKTDDAQKDFLFDNSYSIAESFYCPSSTIQGIYSANVAVGFLMVESLEEQGKPNEVEILRFMIGADYQNKGYGKRAFSLALQHIAIHMRPESIHICVTPENVVAHRLYVGFGFKDNGVDEFGQINLILRTNIDPQ